LPGQTHEDMRPFQSIEGTLEFMKLLDIAIEESSDELRRRLSNAELERYKSGLTLAIYKLNQLAIHVQKSKRILNDLSLIRSALSGDGIIEAEARSVSQNGTKRAASASSTQTVSHSPQFAVTHP
jgi:hypothetical protein